MMFSSTTLLNCLALVKLSTAGYVLEDDYSPDSFFSMFTFFTDTDPTNGFVKYVDQGTASSGGLINSTASSVYMGVDHTNVATSGRSSVRLTSNKQYNSGLIVLDVAHMPGGVCGTWPAFWTVGADWPNNGEIDIIEGVNDQSSNDMTLHTGPGCSITKSTGGNAQTFTGSITTSNCDVNAEGQSQNAGCQIASSNDASFGSGFNSANGGVYATEWTSSGISIYYFSRDSIPSDITSGSPNPSSWGLPMAEFAGDCDISSTFKNNQIVFDTTFCGDWAGNDWNSSSTCASKASTCNDYVQNNPSDFVDAYWSINSLKVYQNNGASSNSTNATAAVAAPTSSTQSTTLAVSTVSSISTPAASAPATSVSVATVSAASSATASETPLEWGEFGQGSEGIPTRHSHRRARHLSEHRRRQIRDQWFD